MDSFEIATKQRVEFVEITARVKKIVAEKNIAEGICVVFVPHTTAAVTINENADPDVVKDLTGQLAKIIPEKNHYAHSEGNSDAHIKGSIIGNSSQIIIHNRALALGAWQGIYFCEFDGPRMRKIWVKIIKGET